MRDQGHWLHNFLTEDPCEAQVKRAQKIMGLEICVLEAQDDVFDETSGTPTNPAVNSGENATDEDIVAPEVTEELNRLKTQGRAHNAPTVDQLMPLRNVYSQKPNAQISDRMVAEGRERELSTQCSQDALFVILRTALRPGTKMVRGRFVDDMKKRWCPEQVHGGRGGKRLEARRTRTLALKASRDDCQSCCNT